MRKWIMATCLCGLILATVVRTEEAASGTSDASKDKVSYAIGIMVGRNMMMEYAQWGADLDMEQIAAGFRDALVGDRQAVPDEEIQRLLTEFVMQLEAKQMAGMEKMKEVAEKNRQTGATFLAQNRTREGIVVTGSGLQYRVDRVGEGPRPTATDQVEVHYRGTHLSGDVFDSSYDRGEPIVFPLGGVIQGWTEVLQLMPVGSKYTVYIPSDLAYGERGRAPTIGPNETLVFEIELLGIK